MEADKFSQIDPILDDITEIVQDQFESEQLRQALKTIGDIVGKGRVACFKIVVEIFDEQKECAIPYLAMGLISDDQIPGDRPRVYGLAEKRFRSMDRK